MKIIYHVKKNGRGAWVIYGVLGVKQYYYFNREQAIVSYREEAEKNVFVREIRKN